MTLIHELEMRFIKSIKLYIFFCIGGSLLLSNCLGKTVARQIYFISPKKKTVFIAPPVNHTDRYLLNDRIQKQLKDYFISQTRFGVVDRVEDSDLYVLLYLYNYQAKDVNDYGFGNREIMIRSGLFVSDSRYQKHPQDKEELGRYYYKDLPVVIEVLDYVRAGDSYWSEARIEDNTIQKMAVTVHELMLSGKLPPDNRFNN